MPETPSRWASWRCRTRARLRGRGKNSSTIREAAALALFARAHAPRRRLAQRLADLVTACNHAQSRALRGRLHAELAPYLSGAAADIWRAEKIGWTRYYGAFGQIGTQKALTKTLVLKPPGPNGEKGVVYAPFEYNWVRLVAHYDAHAFLSEYTLVCASSYSPTDYAALANFAGLTSDPIFVGVSNLADMEAYRVLSPVIQPIPILACDLNDPARYAPRPRAERRIDILMVAHWDHMKRHWLLWEALRDMPPDLRVVLVGRDLPGRTTRELLQEASAFGVRQKLELELNVSPERVADLQCDARVSAIFSDREGSCVAVTESMFADSPVAMMQDAHVGAKAHINEQTGVLLARKGIAGQLARFLEASGRFEPRAWALQHISCHVTTAKLNAILREDALARGRPWTVDIVPFCRHYVPRYVHDADERRLAPAVEDLERRHGVQLAKWIYRAVNPGPSPAGVES
ncbi:MAG TPA: glycosyltransferase [Vicinamibacterales bacterium]|nr:glycosyltransferase [Vicinamibacterales bacterium]